MSEYLTDYAAINKKNVPRFTKLLIGFYFLLCFFEPYLNGAIGSVSKYYIFALMGIVLITSKNLTLKYYHATILLWLDYKALSLMWADDTRIFEMHIISQIGMTALLICLTMIKTDRMLIDIILKANWLGGSVIAILSLFLSKPYHGEAENRLVLNLFGCEADPNNQAALVALGFAVSMYYLFFLRRYKLLSIAFLLIDFYSIMMTGSRGGLVTVLFIVAVVFAANIRRVFTKRGIMLLATRGLVAAGAVTAVIFWLPENIYSRLFLFDTYSGGSERDIIWSNIWELVMQGVNFIFGAGWGSYYGYNGISDMAHNTFLSMVCDVGILGSALFFVPVFEKTVYSCLKKEVLPLLLVVAGLMPSFFIEAINKRFFWNVIFFAFMFANYLHDGGKFTIPGEKTKFRRGKRYE